MAIEQIYTGCLAHGAYYITSKGEAAIIDPLREVAPYVEKLKRDGVQLKYIFETHFHADFVSGHLDLQKATGAEIVYGPTAEPGFPAQVAKDGEQFSVGDYTFVVLHTPGHTLESITLLLRDKSGKDLAIFTGDTLFLGDVGRPDLAQRGSITKEVLAGMLYDSLMTKIMPLANDVVVYPAHGQGSACGKNMMKETVDTLGHQKEINYALNQASREDFIEAVLEGIEPPPGYFGMNVAMNKKGYEGFDKVLRKGLHALSVNEFERIANEHGAVLLDTRNANVFAQGFVPRSINIGLEGTFAPWVGAMLVDVTQPLVIITEVGKEEETVTRLSRVGFDHVLGYLEGGFEAWKKAGKEIDKVEQMDAHTFSKKLNASSHLPIVDVRKHSEFFAGHLAGAQNNPLACINDWISKLPQTHFYLHCQGGYRSMVAASILQARGVRNFTDIRGGSDAMKQEPTIKWEEGAAVS